ncbi:hypothetical protein ACD578_03770 [Microvirga sp. RSM25]|uniref:hypothetical protein n=1 Tax=Microvirga sp. RSM25 TaxID=3273802 RepID=UPI00384DC287
MWGGIVGGIIWVLFRPLLKPLLILGLILYVHNWLTSDPVEHYHQMELRNQEYDAVQDQKRKVLAQGLQIVFEKYGDREAIGTVFNGAIARVSDLQLKCSYERPDEDERWRLTTPVASTGFINPNESKRISFWLRDAASDAIPSSFLCDPVVRLDEGDLMRANIVKPKNSGDVLIAQTDVQINARVGDRTKIDRRKIIAEGLINNHSNKVLTAISLTCAGLVNELGQVRTVSGYTNVYVPPGEVKSFAFQVGLMQEETPKWGIKDLACRVLTVHDS